MPIGVNGDTEPAFLVARRIGLLSVCASAIQVRFPCASAECCHNGHATTKTTKQAHQRLLLELKRVWQAISIPVLCQLALADHYKAEF